MSFVVGSTAVEQPDEVAQEAIRRVRPWAVDASSALESAPGVKDHAKVRAFEIDRSRSDGRFEQRLRGGGDRVPVGGGDEARGVRA